MGLPNSRPPRLPMLPAIHHRLEHSRPVTAAKRPPSTEDKLAWCHAAIKEEHDFIQCRLPEVGLAGVINPAKTQDPYTYDLAVTFPSDLKSVRTPLFKAADLYGLDPQYTVTFNDKDGRRYSRLYPNLIIIFDVKWETTSMEIAGRTYKVNAMHRTYCGFLCDVRRAVVADGCHRIRYARRSGDTGGNAKESWAFDVRRLHELGIPPGQRPANAFHA